MGIFAGIVSIVTGVLGTGIFDKSGKADLAAYKAALEQAEQKNNQLKIVAFLFIAVSLTLGVILYFKTRKK